MVRTDEQLPLLFFLILLLFKGLIYEREKKESGSDSSPNINKWGTFYLEQRKSFACLSEDKWSKVANNNGHIAKCAIPEHCLGLQRDQYH